MAQIDKSSYGSGNDVPTKVVWGWKENIIRMREVLVSSRQIHRAHIAVYRNAYQGKPGISWTDPPSAYTIHGVTLSAEDWGTITYYNGPGGLPESKSISNLYSAWEFIPATGAWVLHANQNNYAEVIALEWRASAATE